jgi:ribosome-associated heat shock protein Hsp15
LPAADTTSLRADKWLWHTRLVKSRTLAASLIENGALRINRQKITKPAIPVRPGDILTFYHAGRVHTVEVVALGKRRGPASEARLLYADLSDTTDAGCAQSTHGELNEDA